MFYYLIEPILVYNWILVLAAVIPAVILMIKVYKSDHIEKESPRLLRKLIIAGILSTLIAMIEERIGQWILSSFVKENTQLYNILLYFVVVAISEESSKYLMMKKYSWNSPDFNCQYDGVVYATFTSLGFALWENINYVLSYGFSTAIVRAITAIPGHACFGVFMGIFYGIAKKYYNKNHNILSGIFRFFSIFIPALLHGCYDYIATLQDTQKAWYFVPFVAVLFVVSYCVVNRSAKKYRYID